MKAKVIYFQFSLEPLYLSSLLGNDYNGQAKIKKNQFNAIKLRSQA